MDAKQRAGYVLMGLITNHADDDSVHGDEDESLIESVIREAEAARDADHVAVVGLLAEMAKHPNDSPEADVIRDKLDAYWPRCAEFMKAAGAAVNRVEDAMKQRCAAHLETCAAAAEGKAVINAAGLRHVADAIRRLD